MYQRVGKAAYKADLKNTLLLDDHLGNPHRCFKSIHVAGTNGKGSICHMLTSVLMEAGFKTGLYTSPHLKDFRERIRVDGKMIPKDNVTTFVSDNFEFLRDHQLSFFEMTVGMAFQYFKQEKVDVALIEVGLGGRLDSTNILSPELSIITNIGLDHMKFLGETISEIAAEKAGIIKADTPVIVGEATGETLPVFKAKAEEMDAKIILAEAMEFTSCETDLKGNYQQKNVKTVLAAIHQLMEMGWEINDDAVVNGLKSVVSNTGILGRWQVLGTEPLIVCDTAHNIDGLKVVIEQLLALPCDTLHMVFGTVDDKSLESILNLLPMEAHYYFCRPNVPRGLDAELLAEAASKYQLKGMAYPIVEKAYNTALEAAQTTDIIFVGGSTFVVAEVV